nr:hypothetical protein [Pseudomonadota bacterium]
DPDNRVNAFHMAGNELAIPCRAFAGVFRRIRDELGFSRNGAHASEVAPAVDAAHAIRLPGITRGGHLLNIAHDGRAMGDVRKRKIMVEMLLTSNELLHGARFASPGDHPIRAFFNYGIPVALGTDDPGIMGITISHEYQKAHKNYGFSKSDLLVISANAVRYGFAPEEARAPVMELLGLFNRTHQLGVPGQIFDLAQPLDLGTVVAKRPTARFFHGSNRPQLTPAS